MQLRKLQDLPIVRFAQRPRLSRRRSCYPKRGLLRRGRGRGDARQRGGREPGPERARQLAQQRPPSVPPVASSDVLPPGWYCEERWRRQPSSPAIRQSTRTPVACPTRLILLRSQRKPFINLTLTIFDLPTPFLSQPPSKWRDSNRCRKTIGGILPITPWRECGSGPHSQPSHRTATSCGGGGPTGLPIRSNPSPVTPPSPKALHRLSIAPAARLRRESRHGRVCRSP